MTEAHCGAHLGRVDLLQVSEGVVQAPGEVEGQEAEHEGGKHNDNHLHRLLFGAAGRQGPPLALGPPLGAPAGLQQLAHHEAVAHHHHHEGHSEHDDGNHGAVHQEVVKKLRAGGVVAVALCFPVPRGR